MNDTGLSLLEGMLALDPAQRLTAKQALDTLIEKLSLVKHSLKAFSCFSARPPLNLVHSLGAGAPLVHGGAAANLS